MICRCERETYCACLSGSCRCTPGQCACSAKEEAIAGPVDAGREFGPAESGGARSGQAGTAYEVPRSPAGLAGKKQRENNPAPEPPGQVDASRPPTVYRRFTCKCGCDWMTILPDVDTCQVCYHLGQPDISNWIVHRSAGDVDHDEECNVGLGAR